MSIATEIADAHRALTPGEAALTLFRNLFERGPNRMSGENKFIALGAITGGLVEWKKQLLAENVTEAERWKKRYQDAKAELDDVKLRLAILEKER